MEKQRLRDISLR